MAKIGVEESLGHVREALKSNGHEVVSLSENVKGCDCCVISGQDKNVMGMTDRITDASVINAEGLTADEVVRRVENSLQKVRA
jgi:hypothetical protein